MAASPGGRIIGRVSVKVLPDTSDFKEDAKRKLEALERRLELRVPTKIDMSGASREALLEIQKINQRNRMSDARKIKFYTTLDTRSNVMREEITKALRGLDDQIRTQKRRPTIRMDVVAGTLKADLDRASLKDVEDKLKKWRDRVSPLEVNIRPKLMLGSTTFAEKRLEYLTRPRAVPLFPYINKLAAGRVTKSLGTMLAAASGARVADKYLRSMWDAFKGLDKSIPVIGSVALAVAGISSFALTAVSNLAALSVTLAQIGTVAFSLPGTFIGAAIGVGVMVAAFKDFNTVLPEVKKKLSDLQNLISGNFWEKAKGPIRSFINEVFPELRKGIGDTATALGSFFASLATSLTGSLDGALPGMFRDLASSISIANGAAQPLAGIIKTLGETGASYLPRLSQWVVDIAKQFDTWLTNAASTGALKLWVDNGIQAVGDLFSALMSIGGIINDIGKAAAAGGGSTLAIFADTLQRIRDITSSDGFQTGLTQVFSAAHAAISALVEQAGPGVLQFFEQLGKFLETALPMAGTAIGTLLGAVATALSNPAMTSGLLEAFRGIAAAVQSLAPAIGPVGDFLGNLFRGLSPVIANVGALMANVFKALAPALTPLIGPLSQIATLLTGALVNAVSALTPGIVMVGQAFGMLLEALIPVIGQLIGALLPVIAQIAPILGSVLAHALVSLAPLFGLIGNVLATIVPLVGQLLLAIMPLIPVIAQAAVTILSQFLPTLMQLIQGVLPPLIALIVQLVPLFMAIIPPLAEASAFINGTFFKVLVKIITILVKVAATIISFQLDWSKAWEAIKGAASRAWSWITSGLSALGGSISTAATSAFHRLVDAAQRKVLEAVTKVRELPGKALDALSGIGDTLANAGRLLIDGFISGIKEKFGTVKTTLQDLTKKLTDWKGPESLDRVLLYGAGQLVMQSFLNGLESEYDSIRKSLKGFTAEIGSTDVMAPSIVSGASNLSALNRDVGDGSVVNDGSDLPPIHITAQTDASAEDIADELLFALKRGGSGGKYK